MLTLLLLAACFSDKDDTGADPVEFSADGVKTTVDFTCTGDADHLQIGMVPVDAVVAGASVDALDWDLRLADLNYTHPLDYTDWAVVAVEGDIIDAAFTLGGIQYDLDPAPVAGGVVMGPAPFHLHDDALALPVGEASGDLNVYRLEPAGFDSTFYLEVTFTVDGGPDRDVVHTIHTDEIACAFLGG